jgi:hypothetical protein
MKLMLEDGTSHDRVTETVITQSLEKLDAVDNTFVILMQNDDVFIQAARYEPGLYALEYRDETGSLFESAVLATTAQVTSAFTKYAQNDSSWLDDFNWRPQSD